MPGPSPTAMLPEEHSGDRSMFLIGQPFVVGGFDDVLEIYRLRSASCRVVGEYRTAIAADSGWGWLTAVRCEATVVPA